MTVQTSPQEYMLDADVLHYVLSVPHMRDAIKNAIGTASMFSDGVMISSEAFAALKEALK